MQNIWQLLPRPFFVLAPMEDVTDTVFRQIVVSCGKPDLFLTEFTNVDGLFSAGRDMVIKRFDFSKKELPLVAQIWGIYPENYFKAAKLIVSMGFSGIDINMGCPERKVVKMGACSALMNNKSLAKEIIQATKAGAGNLPLSIKTRIGLAEIQTENWIGFLLEQDLDAITIHGRTVKEMSEVPAHWDEIGKAVSLRNSMQKKTLIVGNGDILSRKEASEKVETTSVDGVMIGRGIFHDPWLFNTKHFGDLVSKEEKITKLIEHISLFTSYWGDKKRHAILKKFYKCYINGFSGASELRSELMLKTPLEAVATLRAIAQ
ncbi:MAG: tRNA-dihydrouridine synthase [Candidatus Levybacteria bacterium]|nr:tRNA-dihydrouridine synthase [Candidatus Levybacteria bacterium]